MHDIIVCWLCIFKGLLLLFSANGTPILVRNYFGTLYAWPVDFDTCFFDKRPLLGRSKTWRGVFAAIFMSSLLAIIVGMPLQIGALFGIWVMFGDLSASFIKRRLGYIPSSRCRLLDTLPESILPIFMLHEQLDLTLCDSVICIMLFTILEILISPLLYHLHIRQRPY